MAQMAPTGARMIFCFPANPDLADILGRTDLDFDNCHFWIPNFRISRFPDFQNLAPGRAWAGLEPSGPKNVDFVF